MELDFTPTGSVTLENEFEKVKKEGDKSYELGPNSQRADLVIEVVVSSGGIDKLEAYKRLQIPEFIITESTNSSPFLDELNRRTEISILNWSDYQTFIGVGTVQY